MQVQKPLVDVNIQPSFWRFFIFRRLEKDFLSMPIPTDDALLNNTKEPLLDKMRYYSTVDDPSQMKIIMVSYFWEWLDRAHRKNTLFPLYLVLCVFRSLWNVSYDQHWTQYSWKWNQNYSSYSNVNRSTANISIIFNYDGSCCWTATSSKKKKKSLLDYFLDTLSSDDDFKQTRRSSSSTNKQIVDELKTYRKLASQFATVTVDIYNPLDFWKRNKSTLPNLTPLARRYLGTSGTSVKSESAFSTSAYYGRKQRARLSSENLGFSVFLKDKLANEID